MDLNNARKAPRLPSQSDQVRMAVRATDAAFAAGIVVGVMLTILIDLGLRDGLLVNGLFGS